MTSVRSFPLRGSDGGTDHLIECSLWDYEPGHDDPLGWPVEPAGVSVVKDHHAPHVALVDVLDGGSEYLRDGNGFQDCLPAPRVLHVHCNQVPSLTAHRQGRVSQDLVTDAIRNRYNTLKNSRDYNWLQPAVASICDTGTHQPAVAIGFEAQPTASVARLHRRLQPHVTVWIKHGSSGWLSIGASGSLPVFEIGRAGW